MSERTLGVLLLGFGGLGPDQDHQQDMYLPAFGAHPGFDVVGVADPPVAGATAERIAAKLGVPAAPAWRDALSDPAVDVVSVCVTPQLRVDAVTAALRAGKDVLADKPLALTAAECREIAAVAAQTGRVCLPAHHQRFHPMIGSARAAFAAGRIGLPWNVQADFLVAGGTPSGAGELANLGIYPLDVVVALTGQRVRQVYARTSRHWHDGPGDDLALLHLTHDHGITSTVSVGRVRALADTRPAGLAVHRYRVSGSHGILDVDANRPAVAVRRAEGTSSTWHGAGTVDRLLDELHAAVAGARPSSPAPADAVHVAEIIDAARASAASGAPAAIPESEEGNR